MGSHTKDSKNAHHQVTMFRHDTPTLIPRYLRTKFSGVLFACICFAGVIGCGNEDPIVTYKISTKVPDQLKPGKERMLVAMLPLGEKVWFFKVSAGPEKAVETIESQFRDFVKTVKFDSGSPVLSELPEGWRRGGEKRMRFASIDVTTPGKQLDISISNLSRPPSSGGSASDDWDKYVLLNVNRWRGQLGLEPSQDKWGGGEPIELASSDGQGIWLDIVGESAAGSRSMGGPMAKSGGPFSGAGPFSGNANPSNASANSAPPKKPFNPRLKFDRPDGWQDGKMSSMRWAAFNVGSEDSPAEVTVMPVGGDLRANVQRWIGQVIGEKPEDTVVDKALEDAIELQVNGRDAQRFVLTDGDDEQSTAIDATIVPMDGGVNMFIKMTGPAATIKEQSELLGEFLQTLEF